MLLLFDLLFLSVHIGADFKKSFLNLDSCLLFFTASLALSYSAIQTTHYEGSN